MTIRNQFRTLTLASMLAVSIMSPLAAHVSADTNQGSGSGSGSAKFQCATNPGDFDPPTGVYYKSGTNVDPGTEVTNSDTHKKYKCVDQQGWVEEMVFTAPPLRSLPVSIMPVSAQPAGGQPTGAQPVGVRPVAPAAGLAFAP